MRRKGDGQYRVVIEWSNEFINRYVFAHRYFWVEYGPFDWGEAPPCDKVLKATYRSPVTFDGDKATIKKPVGDDPETVMPESKEGGDKMTAVPERSDERPSQGAAADAALELEQRLSSMPQVTRASAMANPREGRVEVSYADDVEATVLADLIARLAIESAVRFHWVGAINLSLSGTHGASGISMTWDNIRSYATGEITLAEFHSTWQCTGAEVPAPPEGE